MANFYSQGGYFPMANTGYYPYGFQPAPVPMMPQQPQPVQNAQPVQQTVQTQQAEQPLVGALSFEVDDLTQIRAVDVPMSAKYVLFPSKDTNTIYKKFWDDKGELKNEVYVKYVPPESIEPDPLEVISERLTKIEQTLAEWSK